MKKVERSGNSIQLPLRINAGQSFILKPNIILGYWVTGMPSASGRSDIWKLASFRSKSIESE